MIKTRLEGAKGKWLDELPSVLWAYQTTACMLTSEIPFHHAFGSEPVIPKEVVLTSHWVSHHDERRNVEEVCLQLDLLDEVRVTDEQRIAHYQDLMAKHCNAKFKPRNF